MAAPLSSNLNGSLGGMAEKQLESQSTLSPRNVCHSKRNARIQQRPAWDWLLRHQIEISSSLILAVLFLHAFFPSAEIHTRKFLHLSYKSKDGEKYRQGPDDLYFVAGWVVLFTALRAITIEWFLTPLAKYMRVTPVKNQLRVAEQGWLVLYYGIFWTLGMYIWMNSNYWLDQKALWTNWPSRDMSGLFKWYYLVQFAFWVQQIVAIHMEAPRKDHMQMLTHHVITCTLIFVTYVYRYYPVANVVLCLMDIVDLLLPIAKILRYFGRELACNITFALLVITWFVTRHILYPQLCWSIYKSVPAPDTMQYGCYSGATDRLLPDIPAHPDYFSHLLWPFWNLDNPVCLNREVKWIFLGMLLALQALSLIWFGMIINVIVGILRGGSAEDTRSDDEGEGAEHDEDVLDVENETNHPLQKRRGLNVTDLKACADGGSGALVMNGAGTAALGGMGSKQRGASSSSGSARPTTVTRRSLLDGEKRKELLARIGCDKPVGGHD